MSGEKKLTPRQAAVLDEIGKGGTNKEVGSALGIAEGTVKAHIALLKRRLPGFTRARAWRYRVRTLQRAQALRLNEWAVRWAAPLPNEAQKELRAIISEQVMESLAPEFKETA